MNIHKYVDIEQFLNYNNTETLTWRQSHNNIFKILHRRYSKWYQEIIELISSTSGLIYHTIASILTHAKPLKITKANRYIHQTTNLGRSHQTKSRLSYLNITF